MARHALQRFASPSTTFSLIVHIAGLASFSASFRFLNQYPTQLTGSFGGNFQFLTIIGLALATATFACGLVADVTSNDRLFAIKNFLSVCSAPLEVLVSILYWGLCAVDKSLVFPPEYQLDLLPDVGFHLMPAVMLSLDLMLLSPPYAIKGYGAMGLSLAVAFLYWGWVEFCFSRNGWYPYPIFDLLSTSQRVLLFTVSAMLMTGSTMLLKWAYGRLNGIEKFEKEAMQPAKMD